MCYLFDNKMIINNRELIVDYWKRYIVLNAAKVHFSKGLRKSGTDKIG
jgi:hypothetical protein